MPGMIDKLGNMVDKMTGVFDLDSNVEDEQNPNDPDQQKLWDLVWRDYQIFRYNRQDMEDIWRKEARFYNGDHWKDLRSDEISKYRPNSVDNIAWSQCESIVSALSGSEANPSFEGQEPQDEQKAMLLNDYLPYELKQIKFHQKHLEAIRRFVVHGPLLYKVIYDPSINGGRGDKRFIGQNDIVPMDMGTFFPDPRVKNFINLQQAKALIVNTVTDLEYFRQRWPEQGPKVESDNRTGEVYIFDYDRIESSLDANRKRSNLIEYWYKGKPKYMSPEDTTLFKGMAQEALMEGKDPTELLAKSQGLAEGVHVIYISSSGVFLEHKSYVYDHGQYPIVARVLFPIEGNPWGKGYMRDLMSPQIMLNKLSELAIENTAKLGNNAMIYEEGALSDKAIKIWKRLRSVAGSMLPVSDITKVREVEGHNIPQTVFNLMTYYQEMLQKIPGRFDSSNGAPNAQINSGAQAATLINASSGRLLLPSQLIEDALEEVFAQYIELMAQFYTGARLARITGKTIEFSGEQLKSQVPTTYEDGSVQDQQTGEPILLHPVNQQAMQQPEQASQTDGETQPTPPPGPPFPQIQVMEEYVPQFDITVSIGVDKPKDRTYWVNTAFQLFHTVDPVTQLPLVDAQAVMYAVDNGKMEPLQIIEERMGRDQNIINHIQQLNQQVQQMGQQLQQLSQQNQQLQNKVQQHNVGESINFKDLPPEGQAQMAAQAGINIHPVQIAQHQIMQNIGGNSNVQGKSVQQPSTP